MNTTTPPPLPIASFWQRVRNSLHGVAERARNAAAEQKAQGVQKGAEKAAEQALIRYRYVGLVGDTFVPRVGYCHRVKTLIGHVNRNGEVIDWKLHRYASMPPSEAAHMIAESTKMYGAWTE